MRTQLPLSLEEAIERAQVAQGFLGFNARGEVDLWIAPETLAPVEQLPIRQAFDRHAAALRAFIESHIDRATRTVPLLGSAPSPLERLALELALRRVALTIVKRGELSYALHILGPSDADVEAVRPLFEAHLTTIEGLEAMIYAWRVTVLEHKAGVR